MSEVYDLDSLAPENRTIKFGNENIIVHPPSTLDALRLGELGKMMRDYSNKHPEVENEADIDIAEITPLLEKMNAAIVACIPELENKKITMAQLLKLVEIISDMSTPTDTKALEAEGITPKDPKTTA